MTQITVALPTWNTPPAMLVQAVESLLAQTDPRFVIACVNDGGDSPWPALEHITDPRLVRFDLPENRGVYYVESLVLAATQTPWWTVHAADDWSDPHRFETLLGASKGAAAVTSPTIYHWPTRTKFDRVNPRPKGHGLLGTIARHPAHIYRTDLLQDIGIPSDLRGSADTAVVSLFWHRHDVTVVREPLYHVRKWEGSLTAHPDTALGTAWRKQQRAERARRFKAALRDGGPIAGYAPDPEHVAELQRRLKS